MVMEPLTKPKLVVQDLGERRQAVGGARGVGDDVGSVRVKLVRVDAQRRRSGCRYPWPGP